MEFFITMQIIPSVSLLSFSTLCLGDESSNVQRKINKRGRRYRFHLAVVWFVVHFLFHRKRERICNNDPETSRFRSRLNALWSFTSNQMYTWNLDKKRNFVLKLALSLALCIYVAARPSNSSLLSIVLLGTSPEKLINAFLGFPFVPSSSILFLLKTFLFLYYSFHPRSVTINPTKNSSVRFFSPVRKRSSPQGYLEGA